MRRALSPRLEGLVTSQQSQNVDAMAAVSHGLTANHKHHTENVKPKARCNPCKNQFCFRSALASL